MPKGMAPRRSYGIDSYLEERKETITKASQEVKKIENQSIGKTLGLPGSGKIKKATPPKGAVVITGQATQRLKSISKSSQNRHKNPARKNVSKPASASVGQARKPVIGRPGDPIVKQAKPVTKKRKPMKRIEATKRKAATRRKGKGTTSKAR